MTTTDTRTGPVRPYGDGANPPESWRNTYDGYIELARESRRSTMAERQDWQVEAVLDALDPQQIETSNVPYTGRVVEHLGRQAWVDLLDDDGEHELVEFAATEFPRELRAAILAGHPFRAEPAEGSANEQRAVYSLVQPRRLTEAEQRVRDDENEVIVAAVMDQTG